MGMLRSMRNELFKYRKRRSMDGSVPAMLYSHYRKTTTPSTGHTPGSGSLFHHDQYNSGQPSDYTPWLNAPSVRQDEYHVENLDALVQPAHEPRLFRPFSELSQTEVQFDYDKAMRINEIFLEIMEQAYEYKQAHEAIDTGETDLSEQDLTLESKLEDNPLSYFTDITDALGILQDALPEDHPDIVNLRQAFHTVLEHPAFIQQLDDIANEDTVSKLGCGNPYEMDDLTEFQTDIDSRDIFAETAAISDTADDIVSYDLGSAEYEMPFMEEVMPESLPQEADLEQALEQENIGMIPEAEGADMFMLEAETVPEFAIDSVEPGMADMMAGLTGFDIDPAEAEILEAMDQIMNMPQEPDPLQMQDDYLNQMNRMFDMDQQYMEDPYQMPDPTRPGGPMSGPMM